MGVKDIIEENIEELDEEHDPELARRREEERAILEKATPQPGTAVPDTKREDEPKGVDLPGPTG
jgi:hypothetical protein